MLSTIAYFTVPTLLLLSAVFVLYDRKIKREIEEKKQAILNGIELVKQSYKQDVEQICQQFNIDVSHASQMYGVANNFFVYHGVSEINIVSFQYRIAAVSSALSAIKNAAADGYDESIIEDCLTQFSQALPMHARGFNIAFYQQELNIIVQLLMLPEPSEDEAASDDDSDDDRGDDSGDDSGASVVKNAPEVTPTERDI